VDWYEFTNVPEFCTASIIRAMLNPYQSTLRYNPEDSHLHAHRHNNLMSYLSHSLLLLVGCKAGLHNSAVGESQYGKEINSFGPSSDL
jgi:hypothetical protein